MICGYDISSKDKKCPGCDHDVETLIKNNQVIMDEDINEISDVVTSSVNDVNTSGNPEVENTIPEQVSNDDISKIDVSDVKDIQTEGIAEPKEELKENELDKEVEVNNETVKEEIPEIKDFDFSKFEDVSDVKVEDIQTEGIAEPKEELKDNVDVKEEKTIEESNTEEEAIESAEVEVNSETDKEEVPEIKDFDFSKFEDVEAENTESLEEEKALDNQGIAELTEEELAKETEVEIESIVIEASTEPVEAPVDLKNEFTDLPDAFEDIEPISIDDNYVSSGTLNKGSMKHELSKTLSKFKPKNMHKFIISFLSMLAVIAVLSIIYFLVLYTKSINILKRTMTNISSNIPSFDGTLEISSDVIYRSNNVTDNIRFDINTYMNDTNAVMYLNVTDEDEIVSASQFIKSGDTIYMYDSNVYEGYVSFSNDLLSEYEIPKVLSTLRYVSEYKNITNIFKDSLTDMLKSKKAKRSIESIKYLDKNIKALKTSYSIKELEGKEFVLNVLYDIEHNDSFIKSLAKVLNTNSSSIINMLEKYEQLFDNEHDVYINIYTDYLTNTYYKFEVLLDDAYSIEISFDNNGIDTVNYQFNNKVVSIYDDMKKIDIRVADADIKYDYIFNNQWFKVKTDLISSMDAINYDDIKNTIMNNIHSNNIISSLYDSIILKKI